jgi:hypothetical protein
VKKELDKTSKAYQKAKLALNSKRRDLWLEERTIIQEYRRPSDPKYTRYLGMLYTESELKEVKQYMEEHSTPEGAANSYMRELVTKGVVEDAVPLTGSRVTREVAGVPYQVRYVGRGGTVKVLKPSDLFPLPGGEYLPDGSVRGRAAGESFEGTYWRVPRTELAGAGELPNLQFSD